MHVLAVEPYFGGSHRAFLDGVASRSQHRWKLITGAARHWKWRMRNAPLGLAIELADDLDREEAIERMPNVVFCSEMLDLPQWRGFLLSLGRDRGARFENVSNQLQRIATLPTVCYFHENQWTYPISPDAREDSHYGYTNLLTALAADEVWFNSAYHRSDFLAAAHAFVARMPDQRASHDLDHLAAKSRVVPPGFETVDTRGERNTSTLLRIGWVARWEHDKRPDRFERLLQMLVAKNVGFELILLGARHRQGSEVLSRIERAHADKLRFSGFAASRGEYREWLRQMDVVVSTADHEFFGIAVCEAISAGAMPLVPDAMSYPEIIPAGFRYNSLDEAAVLLEDWSKTADRKTAIDMCQTQIKPYSIDVVARRVDDEFERLVSKSTGKHAIPRLD